MKEIATYGPHIGTVGFWRSATRSFGVRGWRGAMRAFCRQHGEAIAHLADDSALIMTRDDTLKAGVRTRRLSAAEIRWIQPEKAPEEALKKIPSEISNVVTLYYHDGPVLFTAKICEQDMLCVKFNEAEGRDRIVAVQTDAATIAALTAGELSLRVALGDGDCLILDVDTDQGIHAAEWRRITDMDPEDLPDADAVLPPGSS